MTAAPVVVAAAVHDPSLAVLSAAIAVFAAWVARDFSERLRDARGRAWLAWLAGAAALDGLGIWSMHYTGLLALRLPVALQFDGPMVLLSLLVGVAGSAGALLLVSRSDVGWLRAAAAAIVFGGIGVAGLHYTAMAGMRLPDYTHHHRRPELAVVAVAAAVILSLLSMRRGNHVATLLRGLANPVMHYTAMAAVVFRYTGSAEQESDLISLSTLSVAGVPLMLLAIGLFVSRADQLRKQKLLLNEVFQRAPRPIALLSGTGRVVRTNAEFGRVFGYGAEALGRNITELIVPPEESAPVELDRATLAAGARVDREGVRRRKDGTPVPVMIMVVPLSVAAEDVDMYVVYIDVTESKAAEEARRAFPGRLIHMQEMERRHIARELHDEIGQVLTSATMMLNLSKQLPPDAAVHRVAEARVLLEELIGKVRSLALDLRPSTLDHFGLAAALSGFFDRYTRQTRVRVVFRDYDTDGHRFSSEIETAAYRIVQEALTNVARHAQAQEATVTLLAEDDILRIEVEDRGVGFDAHGARDGQSFGLAGMRERASILGGRLIVHSAAGAGTRVVAELPLG